MNTDQITEIIKSHPELSYDEMFNQAISEGISEADFLNAWAYAKGSANPSDHDKHVTEIIEEIRKIGEDKKDRTGWKEYFKSRGFTDDEIDLAYVLNYTRIEYGPYSPWTSIILLSLLTIVSGIAVVYFLHYLGIKITWETFSHKRFGDLEKSVSYDVVQYTLIIPAFFFICLISYINYIYFQFKKCLLKVLRFDFEAKIETEPMWIFDECRSNGANFLGDSDARITALFKTAHGGNETYFGIYSLKGLANRNEYFITFQKTIKKFPHIQCWSNTDNLMTIGGNKVTLEGGEFNKHYTVYSDDPKNAFYVLNPRVMSALLEPEVASSLVSFETAGEWLIFIYSNIKLKTDVHFNLPLIKFSEYQNIKRPILNRLDLTTNTNNSLSRKIIDDGNVRSAAEIA